VQKFISRLQGIGYSGWVSFEWEKAWLPNIAEPEVVLPAAFKKLQSWARPAEAAEAEAKAKAAAEAAKPAVEAVAAS
jgi:sugar phosphate isomerase/epimerase